MIPNKLRLLIYKFPFFHRALKTVAYNGYPLRYKYLAWKNGWSVSLKQLKDTMNGKRCFIVGNGPSLTMRDLDRLIGEDCFACNGIYKAYQNTAWRPTYFVMDDIYIFDKKILELVHDSQVFLNWYIWRKHKLRDQHAICVRGRLAYGILSPEKVRFSDDLRSKGTFLMSSVAYSMIQLAAYMGYKKIYLLGIDHDYPVVYIKGNIVRQGGKAHFYEDANQLPIYAAADLARNEAAFGAAKEYCDEHNIIIRNATRGGKLEVFERVSFDALINEG